METAKVWKIKKESVGNVKSLVELPEKSTEVNEFARQGYKLISAKALGLEGDETFLFIKADEEFFNKVKDMLKMPGVEELAGEELESVKKKIEESEASAQAGIGSVFKE